jgi:hypothetical protein
MAELREVSVLQRLSSERRLARIERVLGVGWSEGEEAYVRRESESEEEHESESESMRVRV